MPEVSHAVLALIAEMQAKLADPDSGDLTIQLATMTLEGVLPMFRPSEKRKAPNAA